MRFPSLLLLLLGCATAQAQDIEPRRWSQMPTGLNFFGAGLNLTDGDIQFDPVLQIEDGEVDLVSAGFSYIRSFGLFGRSARVDLLVPYATGHWDGLLSGEPASRRRHGFADPRLRMSVLLYGGPALAPAEFAAAPKSSTVIGAALSVTLPWGHYIDDRLINLGANRWVLRPQLGVTHQRGPWTWELTGSVFVYGENDRFFQGSTLETDPLWALQAHAIYTFRPGLWASLGTAYGFGGDSQVNGVDKNAQVGNWLVAGSFGVPISHTQGLRFTLVNASTQRATGADTKNLTISWSVMF